VIRPSVPQWGLGPIGLLLIRNERWGLSLQRAHTRLEHLNLVAQLRSLMQLGIYQFLLSAYLPLLRRDLLLLLLNRIEHCPNDRVVVDEQVALVVLCHCFWDDLLNFLRNQPNVFFVILNSIPLSSL